MLERISLSHEQRAADPDRSANENTTPSVKHIRRSFLTEDDIEAYTLPEDPFFG